MPKRRKHKSGRRGGEDRRRGGEEIVSSNRLVMMEDELVDVKKDVALSSSVLITGGIAATPILVATMLYMTSPKFLHNTTHRSSGGEVLASKLSMRKLAFVSLFITSGVWGGLYLYK